MEQEPLWHNDMDNELSNDQLNKSNGSFEGLLSSSAARYRMDNSRNNSRGSQGEFQLEELCEPHVNQNAEAEWMKIFAGDDDEFDIKVPPILDPILNILAEDQHHENPNNPNMFLEEVPGLEALFSSTSGAFKQPTTIIEDLPAANGVSFLDDKLIVHYPTGPRQTIHVQIAWSPNLKGKKSSIADTQTPSTSASQPSDTYVYPEKEVAQENEETGMDLFESDLWDSMPLSGCHEDLSSIVSSHNHNNNWCMLSSSNHPKQSSVQFPMVFQVTRESQFEILTEYAESSSSVPSASIETYCSCRQSRCLKAYCSCFRSGLPCVPGKCGCSDCQNDSSAKGKESRAQAMFHRGGILEETFEETCCDCKTTSCLKNYCSCRKLGKACSLACRCLNCKNRKPGG
jgi:Tesmin/TSO1-like CXC domain, cysteine-rich domain